MVYRPLGSFPFVVFDGKTEKDKKMKTNVLALTSLKTLSHLTNLESLRTGNTKPGIGQG